MIIHLDRAQQGISCTKSGVARLRKYLELTEDNT